MYESFSSGQVKIDAAGESVFLGYANERYRRWRDVGVFKFVLEVGLMRKNKICRKFGLFIASRCYCDHKCLATRYQCFKKTLAMKL